MDSATLLASAIDQNYGPFKAISFDYGQKHRRELRAAQDLCNYYRVEHAIADIQRVGQMFMYGSSQTSDIEVPEGHYTDESMRVTVVPNRNMIMLAIATAWAEASKFELVAYAAHAGDHAIYPDCRPSFIEPMTHAIHEGTGTQVTLWAPFQHRSKADILQRGLELRVPYHLTWTCYKGQDLACGRCGTCVERLEAFELNGEKDPLPYALETK